MNLTIKLREKLAEQELDNRSFQSGVLYILKELLTDHAFTDPQFFHVTMKFATAKLGISEAELMQEIRENGLV